MEIENLIKLIEKVSESELSDFKYEESGMKLHLTKKKKQVQVQTFKALSERKEEAVQPETADISAEKEGKIVKAPLVGTFYSAPSETADPYVAVGDAVKKGQTLAIVEAMKLMNEIESEYDGTVEEIFVSNGQTVEYGQPLFRIS